MPHQHKHILNLFIYSIAYLNGVYGDGVFATDVAFPYVVVVNNISQFTAMYCLVLFYRANKVKLHFISMQFVLIKSF